jgi:hypothetical protein
LLKICRINENDFTRDRKLTFGRLVTFIINLTRSSLQVELYNFADFLGEPSSTKQAFSKARKKLSAMVFKLLNQKLIIETYSNNIVKTFKGLRVLAIDGSTARLPVSQELCEAYGKHVSSKNMPLAKTSMIFDVLNKITLHASINSYNSDERSLAFEHIFELEKQNKDIVEKAFDNDLVLFDRGYPSLPLMFFLQSRKKEFLTRIFYHFLAETDAIIKSGLRDSVITIPAFKKDRNKNPRFDQYLPGLDKNAELQVRILVFQLKNGDQEIVATSLIDQNKFSYEEIFNLYALRWNIEEEYKFHKSIAEIENFSGKSKLAIEQDFFATIFTCNVCSLLMQEAQDELEQNSKKELKYEYKVNRNILVGIVKNEIIDVFLSARDLDEYCETLKARIKKNLVPIRPNRIFPRIFKIITGNGKTIDRRAF